MEAVFDHVFQGLGIDVSGKVPHSVVLTEPVCNPNYSRGRMSEMLFELYHVPRVAYGVDSLFSLYRNRRQVGGVCNFVCGVDHNCK